MNRPTLADVQADYAVLDRLRLEDIPGGAVVLTEDFPPPRNRKLEFSGDRNTGLEKVPVTGSLRMAWQLLRACGAGDSLLLNQVERPAQWACILQNLLPLRRRAIALYDVFIDSPSALRRLAVRMQIEGATVNVLFSRRQVELYAARFRMPRDRFVFIPYQASHSKRPPVVLPDGGYVFAGGHSARDYRTLCAAAEGTGVPVKVVCGDDRPFAGVRIPANVERVRAQEPEFTRLMAAARFSVMPLTAGRDRGYGEQTILNSFWHGRTMVALDDVSASDYITEGVDGHVLAPGDVEGLRRRLVELWNDPARAAVMGAAGQKRVREHFSHDHFVHRMKALAMILAAGREPIANSR